MKFKYSEGDVVGNLEIKGFGGTSKSGVRLYSVGYLPSNCISCCSWCNRAKNNDTLANFVDKCKKITSRIELDDNYFDIGAERMRNR